MVKRRNVETLKSRNVETSACACSHADRSKSQNVETIGFELPWAMISAVRKCLGDTDSVPYPVVICKSELDRAQLLWQGIAYDGAGPSCRVAMDFVPDERCDGWVVLMFSKVKKA